MHMNKVFPSKLSLVEIGFHLEEISHDISNGLNTLWGPI